VLGSLVSERYPNNDLSVWLAWSYYGLCRRHASSIIVWENRRNNDSRIAQLDQYRCKIAYIPPIAVSRPARLVYLSHQLVLFALHRFSPQNDLQQEGLEDRNHMRRNSSKELLRSRAGPGTVELGDLD